MSSHIPELKNRPRAVNRLRGLVLRLGALSARDKLVAVALLDVLHLRLFRCCVCQKTLAGRLQCSVRTVGRALKALREAGILRWRRRRRRASEYRFNMRLVDDSVTFPDGIDRPYRTGGAPLCVRRDVVAEVVQVAPFVPPRRPEGGHGFVVGERVYGMRPGFGA